MGSDSKKRTTAKVLLIVFSIVAFIGLGLLAQICVRESKKIKENTETALQLEDELSELENEIQSAAEEKAALTAQVEALESEAEAAAEAEAAQEDREGMSDLKAEIQNYLDGRDGTWSVYVKNLNSQEYLSYNSAQLKAASLIKLYIMGAVYDQINKGNLEMTDNIYALLTSMITVSENEVANELVRQLSSTRDNFDEGMALVNAYAQANGFADTSQGRDLRNVREEPAPGENYTSVADCGRFLESVYNGTCVSESASADMLALLKAQERTHKIPAGLPEGIVSANKTGELSDTENDAAIVFGNNTDYIMCVMAQDLSDTGSAQAAIQELSAMVYNYCDTIIETY